MFEEINEYELYLLNFRMVNKPAMPNFDVSAYTDSKYMSAVLELEKDFVFEDTLGLIIAHLKGE